MSRKHTPVHDDEDGFLGRWSRLKRGRQEGPEQLPAVETEPATAVEAQPPKTEAEILEELGLPDPDTLKAGDDFSVFMQKAVPDYLRRRALRSLWGTNPVLANLDELVEYGEDYTDAAMVVENLQTAWKVGRGFHDEVAEEAETAEAEGAEETAEIVSPEDGEPAAAEAPGDALPVARDAADIDEGIEAHHQPVAGAAPPPLEARATSAAQETAATGGHAAEPGVVVAQARRRIRFR